MSKKSQVEVLEEKKSKLLEEVALLDKAIKAAKKKEQEERRKAIVETLEKNGVLDASPEQLSAILEMLKTSKPAVTNEPASE